MRLINADTLEAYLSGYYDLDYGEILIDPSEFVSIIDAPPTSYDIEKVIEKIGMKSFDYYTGSGAAIDVGEAEEIIRRGGIKNKSN